MKAIGRVIEEAATIALLLICWIAAWIAAKIVPGRRDPYEERAGQPAAATAAAGNLLRQAGADTHLASREPNNLSRHVDTARRGGYYPTRGGADAARTTD